MASTPATVRATTSFNSELGGVIYVVHAGDVFAKTAAIVKARPELFEPAVPVESATAAPGEKRNR